LSGREGDIDTDYIFKQEAPDVKITQADFILLQKIKQQQHQEAVDKLFFQPEEVPE